MPFLSELAGKKELMLKAFLSDKRLVSLIADDPDCEVPADSLRYKQVFPYAHIDFTVEHATTFVCFDVDVPEVRTIAVKNCYITVWAFTHRDKLMTRDGMRIDLLANRIDELMNGSTQYGFGRVKLERVVRFAPNRDFYGRELTYFVQDWNRFGEGL
ncbi:MAG: hypothetical protein LBD92_07300 [Oscillospiraceae bacterium]|jgi:hypothetical protein|nr:hypothetical protein [Oscillospiraceae bacterium]